jgi:hypothetical protein
MKAPYNPFFPAAFTLAQRARAAAASLALTAGLLRRSFFLAAFGVASLRFTRTHLAFVPVIMAALPAALNRLFSFLVGSEAVTEVPLTLAHLALAPAAILARAAADMRRFFFGASTEDGIGISPSREAIDSISLSNFSICSLMAMMLLSWLVVNSVIFVMGLFGNAEGSLESITEMVAPSPPNRLSPGPSSLPQQIIPRSPQGGFDPPGHCDECPIYRQRITCDEEERSRFRMAANLVGKTLL